MKTFAFVGGNFKHGYPLQWVKAPENDDTATGFTFSSPYRRVRFDKQNKNFYVLSDGKPVTVFIGSIE